MRHKILTAAYHRNGVGGAGFFVAIVETHGSDCDGRYLVTWFPRYDDEGNRSPLREQDQMAVVNLDMAHRGNIGMHRITDPNGVIQEGTGGNAWRGSDNWGHGGLYEAILEWTGHND